jgi:chaperonin GroES
MSSAIRRSNTLKTVAPAPNQLFCKPDTAETKTETGLWLTESAAEKPRTAEVINVGEGVTGYQQKDTIVYKLYSATEIKLNNEDYFLISEEDVLGTLVEVKE